MPFLSHLCLSHRSTAKRAQMQMRFFLLLSLFLVEIFAAHQDENARAIWSHLLRCDMRNDKGDQWLSPTVPAYTIGTWNPSTSGRLSVTGGQPLVCDKYDMCPLGTCSDGLAKATEVCARFYDACFRDRSTQTFQRNVATLSWTWVPSNGCYFSPLTVASPQQWREWASALEGHERASPMLWVGDSALQEMFAAFQSLTRGATHSDFHRSDVLVNSYTLRPMTATQVSECETSSGGSSGSPDVPCPPSQRSLLYWWEDSTHHRLSHSKWAQAFEVCDTASLSTACEEE